ncbi:MAG: flagellar hook-length control protein FliK [Vampirovibrionales bacterium]
MSISNPLLQRLIASSNEAVPTATGLPLGGTLAKTVAKTLAKQVTKQALATADKPMQAFQTALKKTTDTLRKAEPNPTTEQTKASTNKAEKKNEASLLQPTQLEGGLPELATLIESPVLPTDLPTALDSVATASPDLLSAGLTDIATNTVEFPLMTEAQRLTPQMLTESLGVVEASSHAESPNQETPTSLATPPPRLTMQELLGEEPLELEATLETDEAFVTDVEEGMDSTENSLPLTPSSSVPANEIASESGMMHALLLPEASQEAVTNLPTSPLTEEGSMTTTLNPSTVSSVSTQLSQGIRMAYSQQQQSLTLQMSPESLGRVMVNLKSLGDGQLQARLVAENPEAARALQSDLGGLRQRLTEQGLELKEVRIEVHPFELSMNERNDERGFGEQDYERKDGQHGKDDANEHAFSSGMDAGDFMMNQQFNQQHPQGRYQAMAEELALQQTMVRLNQLEKQLKGVSSPFNRQHTTQSASLLGELL